MNNRWVVGLCVVCGVLGAAMSVRADDASMASDKAELQVLKARLEKLERKVEEQEAVGSGAASGNAIVQLPSGLHGVQMGGFVDTSLGYNFNTPQTRTNTLRVFDTQSQSFMINNAELVVQKPVSSESPLGFKTALLLGTDAEVVGSVTTGLGLGTDEIDVKDAYVDYLAPLGEGLDVKVGKFATMHGAEVIESKDDWNISRSFLFGFAIPFTHTGVRATYPVTSWLSTTVGLNNGWDVVDDNNEGKTLETSFTITPSPTTSLTANYMVGPEQTTSATQPATTGLGSNSHMRHLIDIVASYQPIDPLQLKLNLDYGVEKDGVLLGFDNASWVGLAGYARYALTDRWAVATRTEWFHDADGVRTAFNPAAVATNAINGITGRDLKLWELTLTSEYKLNPHLIGRLEYRHDQASEHVFRRQDVGQRPYQDSIAMEFIAPF
ncbi:MAG: porin [Candidatus Omnitrophica bacterium]|nr:porin [Candidatus Omnitrophota bacterium]